MPARSTPAVWPTGMPAGTAPCRAAANAPALTAEPHSSAVATIHRIACIWLALHRKQTPTIAAKGQGGVHDLWASRLGGGGGTGETLAATARNRSVRKATGASARSVASPAPFPEGRRLRPA